MPLTATLENRILFARDATDRRSPYKCKQCAARMTLKRGEIKVPHFAHVAYSGCPFYKPESEMHFKMKEWVCSQLPGAELEVRVSDTIFDVKFGKHVFECQASQISIGELNQREDCAKRNGLILTWLLACPPFGKFVHQYGVEYTKLKAIEMEITEPLCYLEWHSVSQRMVAFERVTGSAKTTTDFFTQEEVYCATIFEFQEEKNISVVEELKVLA